MTKNWSKVKDIFQDALDLPTSERLDFVRFKSDSDENLFSQVSGLLDSYEEADDFIEKPTVAVSHFVSEFHENSVIGKIIGAYKIEKEIGRGGMGAVYLAKRADGTFDKQVAVKLIKRGLDTDEIVRRFRNERKILAGLDHPNIARLIDGGATEDGLPYLVMDYVEGEPLRKFCRKHALSIKKRLEVFIKICSAVRYAHQNLIIHRDLKPSNILVTNDGTPKLLDFGIAKLIVDEGIEETRNTLTRVMTPEYASPEQITGKAITTASDVYALGVVLYELLTGERPFRIKRTNPEEISKLITDSEPIKPSSVIRVDPKSKVQNPKLLQGDLDNIILMAIRKEPERRYSSVEQFAEDIRRYLNGLPVIARQETFGYKAEKFIKRNKTGVAAGIGIAASLIAGIIATSRQSRIAKTERDIARRETRKAERINQFLQKTLSSADPSEQGKDTTVLEALQFAAVQIESEFADQPEINANLQTTIGRTYLNLEQIEKAEPHLIKAWELRKTNSSYYSLDFAESLNNLGLLNRHKGNFSAAEPLFRESLKIIFRLFGEKHLKIAEVLENLGYLFLLQGNNKKAADCYRQELTIRTELSGKNHPSISRTLVHLGNLHGLMGDHKTAEKLSREALRIVQSHYPKIHPHVIEVTGGLAQTLLHTKPTEAEVIFRDILETRKTVFGDKSPQYAWTLYHLAYLFNKQKRFDEAKEFVRRVLELRGNSITDEHPVISAAIQTLAITLMGEGNYIEAEPLFRESLTLREKTVSKDHWILDTSKSILGECLAKLGKIDEASLLLKNSYQNLRAKLGEDHEQTRNALRRIRDFDPLVSGYKSNRINWLEIESFEFSKSHSLRS